MERTKSFKRSIRQKDIFLFNHISLKLEKEKLEELKKLYKNYHKLYICYKWKYKKLNRVKLTLNMISLSLVSTVTIAGGITLNPIIVGAISTPGILIQGYMTQSNLNNKVDMAKFAFQNYEKNINPNKILFSGDII